MRMQRKNGFSLIEVIVAMAIASFVVAAAITSFNIQSDTYTIVDQTTEAQQNMRAIADLLERDIRATGYFVPEAAALCGRDATIAPDVLFLTDTVAIDPEDTAGVFQEFEPMFVSLPSGSATSGSSQTLSPNRLVLETGVPAPANPAAYDENSDGTPDSDFQTGGGVIIANASDPTQGTACATITNVNLGLAPTLEVDFTSTTALTVAPTDTLIAIPATIYTIDNTGGLNILRRNGVRLADDVEDFQIAWLFDLDRDGDSADFGEMLGAGAPFLDYDPSTIDHRLLREVRINLVVRTKNQNIALRDNQQAIQSQPQAMENRVLAPVSDGFRRRVHTTTIRARNIGFRGRMGEREAQL